MSDLLLLQYRSRQDSVAKQAAELWEGVDDLCRELQKEYPDVSIDHRFTLVTVKALDRAIDSLVVYGPDSSPLDIKGGIVGAVAEVREADGLGSDHVSFAELNKLFAPFEIIWRPGVVVIGEDRPGPVASIEWAEFCGRPRFVVLAIIARKIGELREAYSPVVGGVAQEA